MEVEVDLMPVEVAVPVKPRPKQKDAEVKRHPWVVIPRQAVFDRKITDGSFRVLVGLSSFCNAAGLTWVGQKRLAQELQVSRQVITTHIRNLRDLGYVEVAYRGFRGSHNNTLRVVFDRRITADEAIAVASTIEDCRPPIIKEKEANMSPEEQKAKIEKLLRGVIKPVKKEPSAKPYQMPAGGETVAVKRIRAGMKKPRIEQVIRANEEAGHSASQDCAKESKDIRGVCRDRFNETIDDDSVKGLEMLTTAAELDALIGEVQARYRAEGLEPPKMARTLDAVLDLIDRRLQDGLQRPTGDDRGAG